MRPADQLFLAITFADATVGIMGFVTCEYDEQDRPRRQALATKGVIDAEIARTAFDAHKLPVKGWRFIDPTEIPSDRTYRNALRDTGSELAHDLAHARELHRDMLRVARSPLLADLDVAYMRADEAGDTKEKKRIAAEKQRLRDITQHPALETAHTVEDLKSVWV